MDLAFQYPNQPDQIDEEVQNGNKNARMKIIRTEHNDSLWLFVTYYAITLNRFYLVEDDSAKGDLEEDTLSAEKVNEKEIEDVIKKVF